MQRPADQPKGNHADSLLAPVLADEVRRREVLVLWLIALVFTTGVTALLVLSNWWLR